MTVGTIDTADSSSNGLFEIPIAEFDDLDKADFPLIHSEMNEVPNDTKPILRWCCIGKLQVICYFFIMIAIAASLTIGIYLTYDSTHESNDDDTISPTSSPTRLPPKPMSTHYCGSNKDEASKCHITCSNNNDEVNRECPLFQYCYAVSACESAF